MRLQHESSDPVDSITGIHSDTAVSCRPINGNVHPATGTEAKTGSRVTALLFDVEYIYGFVGWGVCKQSR